MAVVSLYVFRTEPGRLADHLAATAEGFGHLQRLGLQVINFQAIAGGDVGTITTAINHATSSDYVASLQKVLADEQWQEFWVRAGNSGAAVQVESSLFNDVDASFQSSADRPRGVILSTQWRPAAGRLMDFMGHVMAAIPHITRMGGSARVLQSVIGAHPLTVLVNTGFADLDAYGAYADAIADDAEWQAFWMSVMADPTAELIRSGLYVNISG